MIEKLLTGMLGLNTNKQKTVSVIDYDFILHFQKVTHLRECSLLTLPKNIATRGFVPVKGYLAMALFQLLTMILFSIFKVIHLRECPLLKTPPKEIVTRGFVAVMGYLKRLRLGASPCKRTKLMLVGLGGAGKTR